MTAKNGSESGSNSGRRLLGIREYARHRGVAQSSVQQSIREGRIRLAVIQRGRRRLIDPEVADREWAENTGSKRGEEDGDSDGTYAQARARRELANAELAELKLKEAKGALINRDHVRRREFSIARLVRDSMFAVPDRLAAELAAETDEFGCHRRMRAEIEVAIRSLIDRIAAIAEEKE